MNGMMMDIRDAPREAQEAAYERGLIPYIPGEGTRAAEQQPPAARHKPKKDLVLQFKITLKDIHPPIWRRIQIQDCTLDDLHDLIQTAFGWEDYHLHMFIVDGVNYGNPELREDLARISHHMSESSRFGGNWGRDRRTFELDGSEAAFSWG